MANDALQAQVSALTRDLEVSHVSDLNNQTRFQLNLLTNSTVKCGWVQAARESVLEAQRGHKRAEDAEERLRQTQADAAQVAQLLAQAQQKQQIAEQQAQAAAGEIQDNRGHRFCSCEWVQHMRGG